MVVVDVVASPWFPPCVFVFRVNRRRVYTRSPPSEVVVGPGAPRQCVREGRSRCAHACTHVRTHARTHTHLSHIQTDHRVIPSCSHHVIFYNQVTLKSTHSVEYRQEEHIVDSFLILLTVLGNWTGVKKHTSRPSSTHTEMVHLTASVKVHAYIELKRLKFRSFTSINLKYYFFLNLFFTFFPIPSRRTFDEQICCV